jgi:hypothetical protein
VNNELISVFKSCRFYITLHVTVLLQSNESKGEVGQSEDDGYDQSAHNSDDKVTGTIASTVSHRFDF